MPQPPFRAEHVGSLLRPPSLLALRNADHTDEELRAAEDAAILDVIRFQRTSACSRSPTASSAARSTSRTSRRPWTDSAAPRER
jgi:hypothetical protein